jgi:hypothetical protein
MCHELSRHQEIDTRSLHFLCQFLVSMHAQPGAAIMLGGRPLLRLVWELYA